MRGEGSGKDLQRITREVNNEEAATGGGGFEGAEKIEDLDMRTSSWPSTGPLMIALGSVYVTPPSICNKKTASNISFQLR